ncbi:putative RadA recombinase [Vibrio nigripulchritudo MADA3029]|uniref:translesion DNA synthesis-associated protein ImuA n=1 Tax=Vibrio nigripulchritudo TaxID=28173 RepID=UPI0003B17D02|nr:translesion DNA synthesis-associated protein ImuA [Vibrio nigripulchritudo]CCN36883.1 putative RadA recombinase [Vibrio nigripulchritudo AM115]CCN42556.1 putative RadA recombinase [Vibrio nigripulchritudo FTn2]CCN48218.1 putative RadA recombinase [Vibrio nigripulchritudo MADA3020]CCN54840.1 putative RadA recombinase [Vibrio nigripulchritudo MADA3021]CCN58285.1 putative RadA recombinase [Vibrio nigripulchritudo MADA3029]
MHEIIQTLHHKNLLWKGTETSTSVDTTSSGYPELDSKLGGGFPRKGVIEINTCIGIGELRLLQNFMSNAKEDRLRVFIQPPGKLCSEFFLAQALPLDKILIVSTKSTKEALWAAEQCLKSGACSHVVLWQEKLEIHQVKRLQVASETGKCSQIIFKPQKQAFPLPVSLSMTLKAHSKGLDITINKRKGGLGISKLQLDMSSQWADLTHTKVPDTVVAFPLLKRG